jgi:CRP/FNR family cyclic AMP-dependent transcriptional regulator
MHPTLHLPRDSILTPDQMEMLATAGDVIHRPVDTMLVSEGESSDFVLIILSGHVKAVRADGSGATGKRAIPHIVGLHGPGSVVAEMAAVTGQRRTADIITVSTVECIYVPSSAWLQFLHANPTVVFALYRLGQLQRSAMTTRRVESALSAERKLAKALLALEDSGLGVSCASGLRFTNITQHDLAGLADISRESVVQGLRHFKTENIVITGRRQVTVCDSAALRTISEREHRADT